MALGAWLTAVVERVARRTPSVPATAAELDAEVALTNAPPLSEEERTDALEAAHARELAMSRRQCWGAVSIGFRGVTGLRRDVCIACGEPLP